MNTLPETFSFSLSLSGRHAGDQHWTIQTERGTVAARVQTDFGGVLPSVKKVQTSRIHAQSLTSLSYSEGDGRGRPNFETIFDRHDGIVSLRQGRDEFTKPLTSDYHDPVSLLLWLRAAVALKNGGPERDQAQLTGGRVLIQRLGLSELGGFEVMGFFLRPGNAYVYIETKEPYHILRLIQPTDFGAVEANLQMNLLRKPLPPEREKRRRRV